MTGGVTPSTNERFVPPDLAEFLARRMRDISARINCHTIGTIQSFDAANQTATIKVNFQKVIKGINSLNNVAEASDMVIDYPALVNVPVMFAQGGGAYLTFPIAAGDTCMVLFCDRDMDIWFATAQISPPNSERIHDINDAVAIVGLRDLQNPVSNYNTEIVSLVDKTGERLVQAGFLQPYAGSTAPLGWLLCYGQAISRTTYNLLFAAIGTTWGPGNGTTTFNVPDMRGCTVAGLDNMGGSDANILTNTYNPNRNTLGAITGEEAHQLTIPEMPAHHHTYTRLDTPGAGDSGGSHDVPVTDNTGDTGGDVPHQNVQPTRMVNWLIKI